jgi:hypothetical protein
MSFKEAVRAKVNIYFYCYDLNIPSGGIRVLYKHVDILNKNGFSAFILHQNPGFRCTWFENLSPVANAVETRIMPNDYLVIPEEIFAKISKLARGTQKIVFNQNCYYTFSNGYSLDKTEKIISYQDKEVIATLVVSDDSNRYLSYAFPGLKVVKIHNSIDPHLFFFNENKKPLISFMPRKHMEDALQVINILKYRDAFGDFEIMPIADKTETEVAQILRESLIFLSFGYPEGFSLPPAEAMACGCVVIGYHGMGGQEFFKPEFSYPVTNGDIITFAQTIEKVIALYKSDKNILTEKGKSASQYILKNYSPEQQEKDIIQFWKHITENHNIAGNSDESWKR